MKITRVKIENFLSIGNIDLDLNKSGLNLVLGKNKDSKQFDSNGSGKSGLFESIIWCLFGETLRSLSPNEIIRSGESQASVVVELDPEQVGQSLISVTRVRTGSRTTVEVTNDGHSLFPSNSITDKQKDIDKLLGLDFKTFINSVYFGKGLVKFFMSSSDTERKELLETILQIVSFDEAHERSKEKLKEYATCVQNYINETELLKARIEEKTDTVTKFSKLKEEAEQLAEKSDIDIKERIKTIDIGISALDTVVFDNTKENAELTELINKTKKELKTKENIEIGKLIQEEIKKLNELKITFDEEREDNRIAFELLENTLSSKENKLDKEATDLNEELSNFDGNIKYTQNKHKEYIDKKNKYNKLELNSTCPTCLQEVEEKDIKSILVSLDKKIGKVTLEISKLMDDKNEFITKIINPFEVRLKVVSDERKELTEEKSQLLNQIINNYKQDCNDFKLDIANKKQQVYTTISEQLQEKTNDYQAKIEKLDKINTVNKFKIDSFSVEKKNLIAQLKSIKENVNKYNELIETAEKGIIGHKKHIKEYNDLTTELYKVIERTKFWSEAFGPKGIRSFIFEQALPFITERSNYYSTHLTGGSVKIEILPTTTTKTTGEVKEKIKVVAKNSIGADIYSGNSEGEKRRIDVCILLALQDLISSRASKVWNTLIFDELFDALDETGIQLVIELFRGFTNKNIFIISHSNGLKQFFDQSITVVKENGISTCV